MVTETKLIRTKKSPAAVISQKTAGHGKISVNVRVKIGLTLLNHDWWQSHITAGAAKWS